MSSDMTQRLVGGSVSFDHAADVYDATRALPPQIVAKQTAAILAELRAAGTERLLEVGIGTGRCSRPLMERGVRVAGVDLAPKMIARLREQLSPRHLPPDLLFGDATRLPLRDASFRATLMAHVLHLVSDWQRALEEMRRVLAPGGVFLHDRARYDDEGPWRAAMEKREALLEEMGIAVRRRPRVEQIEGALREMGGSLRVVQYYEEEERQVASHLVERLRNRIDSWTWEIPEALFPHILARYESWCREHYDLEREYQQPVQYTLEVWSFA
jgi:ubiquinone/menaquinone biosynthesis C-methylase UbiE